MALRHRRDQCIGPIPFHAHRHLRDRDRYRRIVALCKVSGDDIGAWLVRHGWALDYGRYSSGTYANHQSQARSERRGIWQGEFEAPWAWRRR